MIRAVAAPRKARTGRENTGYANLISVSSAKKSNGPYRAVGYKGFAVDYNGSVIDRKGFAAEPISISTSLEEKDLHQESCNVQER
jgi:hypothetical protein